MTSHPGLTLLDCSVRDVHGSIREDMRSEGNHIFFEGGTGHDPLAVSAALYNLIQKQGYQDVILDFKNVGFLSPAFMLPLVSICRSYRREKVDFDILMPAEQKSAALMSNTNWAHLIAPERYEPKVGTDLTGC